MAVQFTEHKRKSMLNSGLGKSNRIRNATWIQRVAWKQPDGQLFEYGSMKIQRKHPRESMISSWSTSQKAKTYPAIYMGILVEGVELTFENGRVVKAAAEKNQDFLLRMLDSDPGARYLGEFAIGLNYQIDQFTRNILLDEKIGGSFHIAVGAGYPETGSRNKSIIHWDMICDMRRDSEMRLDGEVVYQNGRFTF